MFYWIGLFAIVCTLPICFSKTVRNKDDCDVALILSWSISICNHETCKNTELEGP